MRETKFRVIVKVEADVARDDPARFEKGIEIVYFTVNEDFLESPFRLSDWASETGWRIVKVISIDQYTGIKDKDSKEIYDGDIVELEGYMYRIKYIRDGFKTTPYPYPLNAGHNQNSYIYTACKIIGNIYANDRKLLENKNEQNKV